MAGLKTELLRELQKSRDMQQELDLGARRCTAHASVGTPDRPDAGRKPIPTSRRVSTRPLAHPLVGSLHAIH